MGDVAELRPSWNPPDEALNTELPAFEPFFEEQKERLLRILSVITGSGTEAEDLAQEAFTRVFERWETVAAMDDPAGYLHRTAPRLHPDRALTTRRSRDRGKGFNRKAAFRYTLHAGPDGDGFSRWRNPFSSGLLRSRELPRTMRRSITSPLVSLPPGTRPAATMTVSAEALPLQQRLTADTTAHNISMGRRLVVETMNSTLKGAFVNLEKGQFRVFGADRIELLLGFTVAALNVRTVRSWRARLAADALNATKPRARAGRRRGTYMQILGLDPARDASDPARGPPP